MFFSPCLLLTPAGYICPTFRGGETFLGTLRERADLTLQDILSGDSAMGETYGGGLHEVVFLRTLFVRFQSARASPNIC